MRVAVPSWAVTRTSTVLLPVTRDVFPEIEAVAVESVGVATTVTEVVPLATVKDEPAGKTDVPLRVKAERVAIVESRDFTDELDALPLA